MENLTLATSNETYKCCKSVYVYYKDAQICINEGSISINNSEDSERVFIRSNVDEPGIVGT